ncbi:GNAT family N-acetyltransferase [Legionella nagasakiensis]|uniref:GNAT family N-acetyltransferase n=1 Tax=Legionella nagasakiensis TaxID=535290 RepID=UPI0010559ED8|nr:GNAT family N-acetyltransferase [Legionella nagasakiensis]
MPSLFMTNTKERYMHYSIRPILPKDTDQLFTMFIDLVKHEGIFERFKLTRSRLENELFGTDADWNCLVAVNRQDQLIGFCLYTFANINRAFNRNPMIQIDDLYVSPSYRRLKVGRHLLKQLALIAKEKNIGRFNIWCVKDNTIGQNFYQKIDAEKLEFIDVYSLSIDKLLS